MYYLYNTDTKQYWTGTGWDSDVEKAEYFHGKWAADAAALEMNDWGSGHIVVYLTVLGA